MSTRLPFEILPTRWILDAPYPETQASIVAPILSISSSSVQIQKTVREVRALDEEQGKKILALIYDREGSIEKKGQSYNKQSSGQQQTHQSSFYINQQSGGDSTSAKNEKKHEMDLIDRVNDYLGIESKRSIKHIDRELLIVNNITLNDLIALCDIGISDLWSAGIVTCVKDLRALKFQMNDIVINRSRFQAQQLRDLFGLNHDKLRKMKGVEFGVIDLLCCNFYPNELEALSFSFDRIIRRKELTAIQLKSLKFSLADLITLGFQSEHLPILGVSREQAIKEFKWDAKEYDSFVD